MGKVDWIDYAQRVLGILAVTLGLGGGPVGFWLGRRQRAAETGKTEAEGTAALAAARKVDAEALGLIRGVYGGMVEDLARRMDAMEVENSALRSRVVELEGAVKERDARILHLEELVAALQE